MQFKPSISQNPIPLSPPIPAEDICSCKLAIAAIASAIFTGVIISSTLILCCVITLSIPLPVLIIAMAISFIVIIRLIYLLSQTKESAKVDEVTEFLRNKFESDTFSLPIHKGDILTETEQLALRAWTSDLFVSMNNAMATSQEGPFHRINQVALKALSKLPPAPNQLSLARGGQFSHEEIEKLYPLNKVHQLDRFMSASTSKGFSGNTSFVIQGKTGRSIEKYSISPGEHEVLFVPGSKFLVTSVSLTEPKFVIHLKEV